MSLPRRARRSKFGAIRTEVDGVMFASRREAHRYAELKLLVQAGEITGLELQPKFPLEVCGQKVCTYVADFRYQARTPNGRWVCVVEDVKGLPTPIYRLKKKMVAAQYAIEITEVR